MRAAIRGDFERLANRRGGQELMKEPVAETGPEEGSEPGRELRPVGAVDDPVELEAEGARRRRFFARLLGSR